MNHISDDNYIFNNMFEKAKHYETPLFRILQKLNSTVKALDIDDIPSAEQFLINNVGLINPIVKFSDDNILVLVGYKLRDLQRTPAPLISIASKSDKINQKRTTDKTILSSINSQKIPNLNEEYQTRFYETLLQEHENEKIEKIKLQNQLISEHKAEKIKLITEHEAEKIRLFSDYEARLLVIDSSKKANIEIDKCLNKIKGIYESIGLSSVKIMIVVDTLEDTSGSWEKRIIHYPKNQNYSFKDNTPNRDISWSRFFWGDHFTYQSNPPKNILHLEGDIHENPDLSKFI